MATSLLEDSSEKEFANIPQERDTCENVEKPLWKRVTIRKYITVEPVMFLFLFANILSQMASQTLGLEKTCRVSLELGDEICTSLRMQNQSNNFSVYEKMVQEYYSAQLMWKSALQSLLPCFVLIFVGGWSDLTGRRTVVMLIPLIGDMLQSISNIINVMFFYQLPLEVLVFFDAFFIGIAGGSSVMFLAAFNYLCNITTDENRTHRLGWVSLCTFIGMPMGTALSGIMLKQFGYYVTYRVSLTLHVFNFLYISLRLSEPPRSEAQRAHDSQGVSHFLRTFFRPFTIRDTIMVILKKSGNRRLRLCVLLVVIIILYGPVYGEQAVLYMSTRYRFNWNEVQYSLFRTFDIITNGIGTILSTTLISKYLQWHDSVLGISSAISKIASAFVYCFASNEYIFFIGSIVDMLNGTALLAVRAIYSKLLQPDEIGKMNSLVGLIENLMPLLYVSVYTKMYTATMEILPGAIYLLGATMTAPSIFVFIWLLREHRKDLSRQTTDKRNEIPMTLKNVYRKSLM